MDLMIVESPAKAKKIQTYFEGELVVKASFGHIRDLPLKEMGIEFNSWKIAYIVTPDSKKVVASLKSLASNANKIYFATDDDREGEAIAFHLAIVLKVPFDKVIRVKYGDISKASIRKALDNPTSLNMDLVRAQEARRALDRLVGYSVSPALSQFTGMKLSAGRVQSVAVRLIVERYLLNQAHQKIKHYGAEISCDGFKAKWHSEPYIDEGEKYNFDRELAVEASLISNVRIGEIKVNDVSVSPKPALSTSSLQQEGGNKLNFDLEITMKLAQSLFDKALITYHRTDSIELAPDSVAAIRSYAADSGLPIPETPNTFKNKSKGAQEAHEAIRPTDISVAEPSGLTDAELKLYKLIYMRALASQLAPAKLRKTKVSLVSEDEQFEYHATGSEILFDGFLKLDPPAEGEGLDAKLPSLSEGDLLSVDSGRVLDQETKPPSLFTQPSLVKELERLGIGRPSTWAAILVNIKKRGYIGLKGKSIIPSDVGIKLTEVLSDFGFVDYQFTSRIEEMMDLITQGDETYHHCVDTVFKTVLSDLQANFGYTGEGESFFVAAGEREFTPTPNMLAYVDKIATGLELDIERLDLTSGRAVKEFLGEYIPKFTASLKPSPGQVDFAISIAKQLGIKLSDDVLGSLVKTKDFIENNKDKLPPHPNSLKLAEKIARQKEIELPDDVAVSGAACQKFLAANMDKKKRAPSRKKAG